MGLFVFSSLLYVDFCKIQGFTLISGKSQIFHFAVFWTSASDFFTDMTFSLDCLLRDETLFFYIVLISIFVTFLACTMKLRVVMERWSRHEIKQHWFSTQKATFFGFFWVFSNGAPAAFQISKLLVDMPVTPLDYHEIGDLKTTIFLCENIPSMIVLIWYMLKGLDITILVVLSLMFTVGRIMYSIFQYFQQSANVNREEILIRFEWKGLEMTCNRFEAAKPFADHVRTGGGEKVVTTGLRLSKTEDSNLDEADWSRSFTLAITSSGNIIDGIKEKSMDFFKKIFLRNFLEKGVTDDDMHLNELDGQVKEFQMFLTEENDDITETVFPGGFDIEHSPRQRSSVRNTPENTPRISGRQSSVHSRSGFIGRTPSFFGNRVQRQDTRTMSTFTHPWDDRNLSLRPLQSTDLPAQTPIDPSWNSQEDDEPASVSLRDAIDPIHEIKPPQDDDDFESDKLEQYTDALNNILPKGRQDTQDFNMDAFSTPNSKMKSGTNDAAKCDVVNEKKEHSSENLDMPLESDSSFGSVQERKHSDLSFKRNPEEFLVLQEQGSTSFAASSHSPAVIAAVE